MSGGRGAAVRPRTIAAFLVLGGVTAFGCGEGGGDAPGGGVAVLCADQSAESLNPLISPDQLAVDLSALLFTPLVRYREDGELRPYLATEWSWDEDRRSVRILLRDDVVWHDGTPLTAEDVAWTIHTAADPEYGAWSGPDLAALEEAAALDSSTVQLRFSAPLAAGMEPFAALPILPRHLLDGLGPEAFARADYNRQPVGSGPYRIVSRAPDGSIALARWDEFPEGLGRPAIARFVFRPVTEDATLVAEMRTRGVDACVTGAELAGPLAGVRGVEVLPLDPPAVQVLVLDLRRPVFRDARVRRALSAALVRRDVAAAASARASPARSFLPPASRWIDPSLGQPDTDPSLADSLLDAAGWSAVGPDSVRVNEAGEALRFSLVAPLQMRTTLTAVQGQLRRAGVDVRLEFREWAAYVRMIQNPDARPPAMALSFVPERILHPDYSGTYHSESPMNIASYASAETDSLLARIEVATDTAALRSLYAALQRRLAEDAPVLYLAYVPRLLAVGPDLAGVRTVPGGPFISVTEWRLADDGGG